MESFINFIAPILGWLIAIGGLLGVWYFKPTRKPTQSDSERIDKLRKDIKEMSDTVQKMDDIMNKPK